VNGPRLVFRDNTLHVEAYPGAINVIQLRGKPAVQCMHLGLHRTDLEFAQGCLEVVRGAEERYHVVSEAAWRSAMLHYCKCFAPPQGGSGRTQLSATRVFGKEDSSLMKQHRRIMDLRNTHLVHDDGTHNWCALGAVIEPIDAAPRKVRQISFAAMDSVTLNDDSLASLEQLVATALEWAKDEFQTMANGIILLLHQAFSHSDLTVKTVLELNYKGGKHRPG
jgi:hypothetical protein